MSLSVRILLLALLMSWTAPTAVVAQNLQARDWAGACTGCHSTGDRRAVDAGYDHRDGGAIPAIAGMDKQKFVELMIAFRNGTRDSTVMHQLANGLSKEQINALGEYFSARSPR